MLLPRFDNSRFIENPPDLVQFYSEEELNEIRLNLRDRWIDLDNKIYDDQHSQNRSPNNREPNQYEMLHQIVRNILEIDPTNFENVSNFDIDFSKDNIQKMLIGLHNYQVYFDNYKPKNNYCYIPKTALAAEARRRVFEANYEVVIDDGEDSGIPDNARVRKIIRCFERENAISFFAFALLNDLLTDIIMSHEEYPSGRLTNSRRNRIIMQTTTSHQDPSVAIHRFPMIRNQNLIPTSPTGFTEPFQESFEIQDFEGLFDNFDEDVEEENHEEVEGDRNAIDSGSGSGVVNDEKDVIFDIDSDDFFNFEQYDYF